ncbi:MAG: class I SAM-dependent methyltransferase [Patescibacteria group bacterium]|nr:class I SAM-dependent methyltransferase [Patescibacteria group bacterium]
MAVEDLQQNIIKEFGSDVTQENYLKKADRGLWNSEKILIAKFFKPKSTLLDIGCGTGRTTIPIYKLGYKVLGIDLVPEMITNAKKIAQEKNLAIDYEVNDATNLKYHDNSFDNAIFSTNGFGQIPSKQRRQKALEEIYRVIKPGGYFILVAHAKVKGDLSLFWFKNFLKLYILKPLGINIKEIDFGDYIFVRNIDGVSLRQTQFMHIANEAIIIKQLKQAGFNIIFTKRENEISDKNIHDQDNVYNHPPIFFVCQK